MIGRVILTCLEIICLVLGIMFVLGSWNITGFSFFDSPFGGEGIGWGIVIGSFFILIGILFFMFSLGGKRNREEWNEENAEEGDMHSESSKGKRKGKRGRKEEEEEW